MHTDVCHQTSSLGGFDPRLGFIAVFLAVGLVGCGKGESPSADPERTRYEAARPADQVEFAEIIAASQQQAQAANNDLQLGGIKGERDRQICSRVAGQTGDWWANPDPMTSLERVGKPLFNASQWVGRVESLDATSDGFGVLVLEMANGVTVGTYNNALSDMATETLIRQTSPLFSQVSALSEGQWVTFSGSFLLGNSGDCFYEKSMSLAGKVRNPEFLFRFAEISPMTLPPANNAPSPTTADEQENQVGASSPVQPMPSEVDITASASQTSAAEAAAVDQPSFDCSKASTLVETTICGNGLLARLDVALARTYSDVRGSDIGDDARSYLRNTQREWMQRRNRCADVSCIERAYRDRIDEVCETPVLSGVHPGCLPSSEIQ